MQISRREFTRTLAAASTAAAFSSFRVLGANDRVRIGFIGVGNRGDQVLDAFLKQSDVDVVAVADIYEPYLQFAVQKCGTKPRPFKDYRQLLELKDVDAVVIATPDHWHALQTIQACQAGKDVYVEKPISLRVAEGRAMVEAVKRNKRVSQSGLVRRSSTLYREVADLVRNGAIGKVTGARCFHIQNEWPKGIGNPPDSAPPAGMDWEAWMGPAPKVAYNRNRALYQFRWFYDYSGGQVTNMGIHYMDVIHWALGQNAPLAVTAMGGKYVIADNREIPDTMEVLWHYPGDTLVSYTQFNANSAAAAAKPCEIEFRGTKGTLYVRGNGWEIVPELITQHEFPQRSPIDRKIERGWRLGEAPMIEPQKGVGRGDTTAEHARNFLDCVKNRGVCNSDIESAHRSTSTTLLANIALQTRSYLEWDAKAEKITNNPAANKHLRYDYRAPLKSPV